MLDRIKTNIIVRSILSFLGTAPGALRRYLNVNEVVRIVVATFVAGGGAFEALRALAENVPAWVEPSEVGLATALFVLLFEAWRRLGHGSAARPTS